MTLRVYDRVARTLREFQPLRPGKVGMYVCGMTVQDKPHVGHMFAFVACDMIRRYLEYLGYEVTYVQNFTDVDDKIIDRARQEGVDFREVAQRNIALYHEYARQLNIKPATVYPLVTEHIPDIIAFIERLIAKGHAYAADGDVYFSVRSDPDYGFLSGRDVEEMRSGVRVEVGEKKRDPLDFALWKAAGPDEPGWDSPWGRGRPGWHIECSVMSTKYLGNHFEFHGGGKDLLFPHHENECAQSMCATGEKFVDFWLHNGLLYLGDRKMSKSDGNFFAMGDVLEKFPPQVIRFFLLNAHFRSELDYSEERLREAQAAWERLRRGVRTLRRRLREAPEPVPEGLASEPGRVLAAAVADARKRFFAALDEDFNSGGAIGALFGLVRAVNQYDAAVPPATADRPVLQEAWDFLADAVEILGLDPGGLEAMAAEPAAEIPAAVRELAERRAEARRRKDWQEADLLRDRIAEAGFTVVDGPDGYRLEPRE